MSVSEIAAKYGWLGFCRKARVRIAYSISNIVLCAGCPEFVEPFGETFCRWDRLPCPHGWKKGSFVCASCPRSLE